LIKNKYCNQYGQNSSKTEEDGPCALCGGAGSRCPKVKYWRNRTDITPCTQRGLSFGFILPDEKRE